MTLISVAFAIAALQRVPPITAARVIADRLPNDRLFSDRLSKDRPSHSRSYHWRSPAYSLTLLLAALITGPHFAISCLRKVPSSSGVEPAATTPSLSNRALIAGSPNTVLVSTFTLRTISDGVLAGIMYAK